MNNKSLMCAYAAVAAIMITAMPAMANISATIKTNVPFPFVASGKTMPAGAYVFEKCSPAVTRVRHEGGATALTVVTHDASYTSGSSRPQLVFVKKNGQYHLNAIELGATPGRQRIPTK